LVFLDETGTTTKTTRLRGGCLKGQRLLSSPDCAVMASQIFETYVETTAAKTLGFYAALSKGGVG
jgi:hypothetical protein